MRKYTFIVEWSDEDSEHVGLCLEFSGLSWLEKTPEAALAGIRTMVAETVAELIEKDEPLPEPLTLIARSGQSLRLNTPEEDAAINAGIAADPDTFELTEEDIKRMRPFREWAKERGIPVPIVIGKVTAKPDDPLDE